MKISKAREKRNKKKIRAEGTALERNLKSLMFYIHFTWAENKIQSELGKKKRREKDLLDRNIDYIFLL